MYDPNFDAIDVANFTQVWTTADLDALHERGVRLLVVGASYGDIAQQQLAVATVDGRFQVDAYGFCTWDGGLTPWANAYKAIAPFPTVRRIWLDLELPVGALPPAGVLAQIQRHLDMGQMWRPDITSELYTAAWWWNPSTNFSSETFGRKLWYAAYNDTGRDGWEYGDAFGHWHPEELALKQYAGSVTEAGLNVDVNYILEDIMDQQTRDAFTAVLGTLAHQGAQIEALGSAFIQFVQAGGIAGAGVQPADFAKLKADFDAFKVKAMQAGALLGSS